MKAVLSMTQRPLLSAEEVVAEAIFVATLRLGHAFGADFEALFKEHGLTGAQYNTLRVLRDAGPDGLSCQEISAALIQRDPDVTRLADRLEERGLVSKMRSSTDRRVVLVRLTGAGLSLVSELDVPIARQHTRALGALAPDEKARLLELLQKALRSYQVAP